MMRPGRNEGRLAASAAAERLLFCHKVSTVVISKDQYVDWVSLAQAVVRQSLVAPLVAAALQGGRGGGPRSGPDALPKVTQHKSRHI